MNAIPDSDRLPLVDSSEACCPSFLTSAITESEAVQAAHVFKALADPARVRLLSMIATAGPEGACVCELVPPLELAQPTVSHHLRILQDAGLVSRERRGTWAYYRIQSETIAVVAGALQV
jgi:ArsR family transcriptional regulator